MPVDITSQPAVNELFFLSDNANFQAGVTAIDPNKIHKITSQVFTGANALCAEDSRRLNAITENKRTEIMNVAKDAVIDFVPDLVENTNFIPDPNFNADVFVKFKEVILETGVVPIETTLDSNTIQVINSYLQPYQDKPSGSSFILTDKKRVHIFSDAYDWVRAFGTVTATFDVTFTDGTTDNTLTTNGTDGLIPTGPAQIQPSFAKAIAKYTVSFDTGGSVTYIAKDPCCKPSERIDVYYLESKGSWGVMHFKCPEEERVHKDFGEVFNDSYFGNDASTYFKSFGRNMRNYRSWMSVDLRKADVYDGSNIEAFRAFARAKQYRATFRFADTNKDSLLAPFVPTVNEIGSMSKKMTDWVFSGYYGVDLQ